MEGRGSSANSADASGMTIAAIAANNNPNTSSVRPPIRPMAPTSVADATPVMSSETTNGMTVIRMAFTQSVPTGASASAASSSGLLPDAAMSAPPTAAAASATSTRVLSFIFGDEKLCSHLPLSRPRRIARVGGWYNSIRDNRQE